MKCTVGIVVLSFFLVLSLSGCLIELSEEELARFTPTENEFKAIGFSAEKTPAINLDAVTFTLTAQDGNETWLYIAFSKFESKGDAKKDYDSLYETHLSDDPNSIEGLGDEAYYIQQFRYGQAETNIYFLKGNYIALIKTASDQGLPVEKVKAIGKLIENKLP